LVLPYAHLLLKRLRKMFLEIAPGELAMRVEAEDALKERAT
jgi:hypothetical protein